MYFFPVCPLSDVSTLQCLFIILCKVYYRCDHLCVSRYRLLNLQDMRRTTQRWNSVRHSVRTALIVKARKKLTLLP